MLSYGFKRGSYSAVTHSRIPGSVEKKVVFILLGKFKFQIDSCSLAAFVHAQRRQMPFGFQRASAWRRVLQDSARVTVLKEDTVDTVAYTAICIDMYTVIHSMYYIPSTASLDPAIGCDEQLANFETNSTHGNPSNQKTHLSIACASMRNAH